MEDGGPAGIGSQSSTGGSAGSTFPCASNLVEHHHPASQEKEREVGVGEEEEGEEAVGWAEESNGRNPNHNARPSGCDG